MIRSEQRDRVTLVRLDRHEQRNALDQPHLAGLQEALDAALAADTRCVVITGEGSSFCSGADLDTLYDDTFLGRLFGVLRRLERLPVPVLAAVNGPAIGAGTQLAAACDLRVAAPTARFAVPAARLGLAVDPWTVRRLVALAGSGPTGAMLLGADTIGAERAHGIGLVDRLGDLDDALAWAEEISRLAPLTLRYSKLALRAAVHAGADLGADVLPTAGPDGSPGLPVTAADQQAAFDACFGSADVQEAVKARREGRAPTFDGR